MYIHAAKALLVPPGEDLAARRIHLARRGIPLPRRLGRFGLLALLGAHDLIAENAPPPETGVYMATESGAASDTEAVLEQVAGLGDLPKPVHFIHTLSNTAAFYVARQYGLAGPNQTISSRVLSFERTLDLAGMDLQCLRADQALVGAVDETSQPDCPHAMEVSCWLRVSLSPTGAIGQVVARLESRDREEAAARMERLSGPPPDRLSFGPLLEPREKAWWWRRFVGSPPLDMPEDDRSGDAATAVGVCRFLAGAHDGRRRLFVNRDFEGCTSLTLIQRGVGQISPEDAW